MTHTDTVASAVRAELARKGVSGRSLSAALGMSHTGLQRRLRGETAFRVDEVAAIARQLGIPVSTFYESAPAVAASAADAS